MKLQLAGQSYDLRSRAAGVQRTVGMYPVPLESGNERAQWALRDIPGLTLFCTYGAPIRGKHKAGDRVFVVAGSTLYEEFSNGTKAALGAIYGAGRVGMAHNTTQLAISNAETLFVLELSSGALTAHTFPGTARIQYLDQFIFFIHRDSQQFGWTDVGNAASINELSFASAEGSPDNLVDIEVDHRELLLFGADTVEAWSVVGGDDVVARNNGAFIEVGAAAEFTANKIGGTTIWLGSSLRGGPAVYMMEGYREKRISTSLQEQVLQGIDLSGASSFTIDMEGHAFWCLNVPGLKSTHVFDVKTGMWHEWCDMEGGLEIKHRARMHVYAFGRHLVGSDDGKVYELDPTKHNNAGDVLLRYRIFPNSATPSRERVAYGTFHLDCDRGYGGTCQLRYSNDGTQPAGAYRVVSMGAIGVRDHSVKWDRCGSARDRVWEVRCTDDVPFNPVVAEVI